MHNAKSREHAHTCRKARAIFKLRYTNKQNQLSGTICLISIAPAFEHMNLEKNNFEGSLDFTRLPKSMRYIFLYDNHFSGTIDFGNLPQSMRVLDIRKNAISGTVLVPHGIDIRFDGNDELTVERIE
ncbi:hypothetical protein XU18_0848 [Perkinsela sp. CCAP 1560/4]|nr:hypothetical protein XU18_0848 [Perkinsela sp. CCAP 1560/4]|eukprot:KNH08685.1 hypothetical protein XU18_0848 [Perkinsela sp. CCAP 1560/4]